MVTLRNRKLVLEFEPECGGKWHSLRDIRNDREWFWRNPYLPRTPLRYGDSFIGKLDTGGWDEIFPSVLPAGVIPDHGDLVQLPWRVDRMGADRLTLSVEGRCFPFRFERTVWISESRIHCEYRLENTGEAAFPWLWCAHPLLPFLPDLSLEVTGEFDVLSAMGAAEPLAGKCVGWDALPSREEKWAVKLFSRRHAVNQVTAWQADGSGLRIEWDAQEIPYLGLWVNNGAWSGCGSEPYFNIGIEPAMLPVDDLSAVENPPVLKSGEGAGWSLDISLL
jgi:galactose mutarotase-like enzyme